MRSQGLNEALLNELQKSGEIFLSNALVNSKYCLRGCIVNFRTSKKDIEEMINIIVREGKKLHEKMQERVGALEMKHQKKYFEQLSGCLYVDEAYFGVSQATAKLRLVPHLVLQQLGPGFLLLSFCTEADKKGQPLQSLTHTTYQSSHK